MIIIMRREGKGSEVKKRRNWMECLSLPLSSLSFIYTYIHTYIHIRREGYIHTQYTLLFIHTRKGKGNQQQQHSRQYIYIYIYKYINI